jgi:anti-sigma B factor antagonist
MDGASAVGICPKGISAQGFRVTMSIQDSSSSDEAFTLERHGDLTVITATRALERIEFNLEEQVAELILKPLQRQENPLIVFDLSQVDNFGSMFLALLIRCWKLAMSQGGTMALSGVTERTRELLRMTSLDIVWPIYESKREAMDALLLD